VADQHTERNALICSCLDLVKKIVSVDYRCAHRSSLSGSAKQQHHQDRYDDLVQEGYLGLIHAADTYRPEKGRFSVWAALHSHWFIRDYLFRKQRWDDLNGTAGDLGLAVDYRAGDEPPIDAEAIRAAVAKLSDEDQIVVISLFGLDRRRGESTGREIARECGVTPSAIAQRKDRALEKLRRKLTA